MKPFQKARCKTPRCGADIIWAVTLGGSRMPVNAEPINHGTIVLSWSNNETQVDMRFVGAQEWPKYPTRYTSHFSTCPAARQHRRRIP